METSKMHSIIKNPGMEDFLGVSGTYWDSLIYLAIQVAVCSIASIATMYIKRKPL
jgi:hypothetical protein